MYVFIAHNGGGKYCKSGKIKFTKLETPVMRRGEQISIRTALIVTARPL